VNDDAGVAGRALARVDRQAVRIAGLATAAVLAVMFYFPVGTVLAESVFEGGTFTLSGLAEVLTDPFYFGVLADVFAAGVEAGTRTVADPLGLPAHLGELLATLGADLWGLVLWIGGVLWGTAAWAVAASDPLDPAFWSELGWGVLTLPLRVVGYSEAVEDWTGLFGFTAYQALLSTALCLVVGLPGAYVLSRFEFRGRRTLRSLTILPFVLPGIMVATGFLAMFSASGTVNGLLGALGVGPFEFVGTLEVVLLAHAFYNAPLIARVTTAAWESVDRRAVETARSLGAGRRRAFLDVVVPQLLPSVATGALLAFIFTFMTFPIVLALGGLELATVEVWVYDRVRRLDLSQAAALVLVETAITIGLTYAYLRYEARTVGAGGSVAETDREPLVGDLRSLFAPRRLAILGYGAVVVVLFLGPLASMVYESFTVGDALTLSNWEFLLQRQVSGTAAQTKPLPAILSSVVFAVGTLVVAVPMGVVVAAVTTDRTPGSDSRFDTGLEAFALLPLAISGIVVGVGLLRLVFGFPVPFTDVRLAVTGPVAIVAAHAVAAYPFVVRNVAPQLAAVDRSMVESARALGATRARALLDVELPLVATGLLAGAAFAVAISFGEFDSTVILAQGSDSYTMPVAVERFLGRRTGPAMAMGTVLLFVTGLSFWVVDRVGGRAEGL
jgi:thiamine transport system permease protein